MSTRITIALLLSLFYNCASQHIVHSSLIKVTSPHMPFDKDHPYELILKRTADCNQLFVTLKWGEGKERFYSKGLLHDSLFHIVRSDKRDEALRKVKARVISIQSSDGFYSLRKYDLTVQDTAVATFHVDTILDRYGRECRATLCPRHNGSTRLLANDGQMAFSANIDISDSIISITQSYTTQLDTLIGN